MIAAVDLTKIRENPMWQKAGLFVVGEILGVAQVSKQCWDKTRRRELQGSYTMFVGVPFTVSGSLEVVPRCHERHEEDSPERHQRFLEDGCCLNSHFRLYIRREDHHQSMEDRHSQDRKH